jgi:hypothetical protein
MLGYAILGLVILVGAYVLAFYNGTIKLRNAIEEAFATMDVYLKKRYDMIPNLVETVKGYATHEQETLQALTEARTRSMQATTPEERFEQEGGLQSALKSLFCRSGELSGPQSQPELPGAAVGAFVHGGRDCELQKVLQRSRQAV